MSDAALHSQDDAGHGSQPSGRALATFVSVTFGFSWLAWLPLVFSGPTSPMPWNFYLGSMGPALGAIATTLVLRPDGGFGSWARRTFAVTGIGGALAVVVVSFWHMLASGFWWSSW